MRAFFFFILNCFLLILIVFFGLVLYSTGKTTKSPALVGRSYQKTRKEISKLGFNLKVKGKVKSVSFAKGDIIWQYPLSGQPIKKGRSIWVLVSDGVPTIKIPDTEGILLAEAKQEVISAGAEVGNIVYTYNDSIEKGFVIASSPMKGVTIGKGWDGTIALLVSLGRKPKRFTVPDFRGLTPKEVKRYLESVNLKTPVEIHNGFSIAVGREEVYAQEPKAGVILEEGKVLELYVNSKMRYYKAYIFIPEEQFRLGALTVDKVEESGVSEEYKIEDSGNPYTVMILYGNSPFSAYVYRGDELIQMKKAHEFTW